MHRAFSFPMTAERCRNKERLEASLAGLCELELLKQRQECLVLGALSLGDTDPGHPAWGDLQPPLSAPTGPSRVQEDLTLRRQLNSLQCPPWGLMAALAQLVGDLRVDMEPGGAQPQGDTADSRSSSGFYELSAGQPLVTVSDPSVYGDLSSSLGEGRVPCAGERPKSISDIFMARRDGLLEPCPRPAVPRSFSAPYASLEGIAEGVGEEDPGAWGSEYLSPGLEESPTAEDFQEALRVEGYILGLIQRRVLPPRPSKPRTTLGPESRGVARQSSLRRKEGPESRNASPGLPGPDSPSWAFQGLEEERGGGAEDCLPPRYPLPRPAALDYPCRGPEPSSSEPDSPQRIADSPRTPSPGDQLVSAHYIPAQPCRAAPCPRAPPAHLLRPAHRPPAPAKPHRTPYSPERAPPPASRSRAPPRKCRGGEADSPGPRKAGRRAGRSQSENSLLGQRGGERKYNTVERDGGRGCQARPRRPQPGSLGYRRWRSTQELSQDEGEPAGEQACRRPRKPRPPPPPYPYPYAPHAHYRHGGGGEEPPCRPEEAYGTPAAAESESSLSEADSRGSSSLSTDSDESGGLVWPQQLPPQLNAAAPPPNPPRGPAQPKAFVKIKASHALKKKILRFRTGSLKVMTTV